MVTKPSISVIIPAHVLDYTLHKVLTSFETAREDILEVIIAFDGPIPEPSFFEQYNLTLRLSESEESQRGPAVGRNRGAKLAQGDILFFCDSDVSIHTDTIQRIQESFKIYSDFTAIIGCYDDRPADQRMISKFRNLLHRRVHYENHGQIKTFWSGCGAIKRQAFLTLGGFDEGFRTASVEDIELGYRLSASGHQIFLDHSVQVCHHKSWSLFSMCYTDCFLRARPWTRLMLSGRSLGTTQLNVSIKDKVMLATLLTAYLLIPISIAFPTLWLTFIGLFIVHIGLKFTLWRFYRRYFPLWALPCIYGLYVLHLTAGGIGFGLGLLDYIQLRIFNKSPNA